MADYESEPRAPRYLAQVQELIDMPLFSPEATQWLNESTPGRIKTAFERRLPAYTLGLMALGRELGERGIPKDVYALTPQHYGLIRSRRAPSIYEARSMLMATDEQLQTPSVRALRSALQAWRQQNKKHIDHTTTSELPVEPLPPQLVPLAAVPRIVNITRGVAYGVLHEGGYPHEKRRLPGWRGPEICVGWDFARMLVEDKKYQLRKEAEDIVWGNLPMSDADVRVDERREYARSMQSRIVAPDKLEGVPELAEKMSAQGIKIKTAGPHHISRTTLAHLMKGGYEFIAARCASRGIPIQTLRQRHADTTSQYLSLEAAGLVWGDYLATPDASDDYMVALHVARRAGFARKEPLLERLSPAERAQAIFLRAQHPKGRALLHIPIAVAERAVQDATSVPLPPHVIPADVIERLVDREYSNVMTILRKQSAGRRYLKLRLPHSIHEQVCVDWQSVHALQHPQGRPPAIRPGSPPVDLDMLPRGPHETDPSRIAAARHIQTVLLGEEAMAASLQRTPSQVIPDDIPDRYRLPVGVGLALEDEPPQTFDALAQQYHARADELYKLVRSLGLPVHEIHADGTVQRVLLAKARAAVHEYIGGLRSAEDGWYRARQVSSALKDTSLAKLGINLEELRKTHPEYIADMTVKPGDLTTAPHIHVRALMPYARKILLDESGHCEHLAPMQMAMVAGITQQELMRRLQEAGLESRTIYRGDVLQRALRVAGIGKQQLSDFEGWVPAAEIAEQLGVSVAQLASIGETYAHAFPNAVVRLSSEGADDVPYVSPNAAAALANKIIMDRLRASFAAPIPLTLLALSAKISLDEAQAILTPLAPERVAEGQLHGHILYGAMRKLNLTVPDEVSVHFVVTPAIEKARLHYANGKPERILSEDQTLEPSDIADLLEVLPAKVSAAIRRLHERPRGLPFTVLTDTAGRRRAAYAGVALRQIEDEILGIGVHDMAGRLQLPAAVLDETLRSHEYRHLLNGYGRYEPFALDKMRQLLVPPPDAVELVPLLTELPVRLAEASAFIQKHGGMARSFYRGRRRLAFTDPIGATLLAYNFGNKSPDVLGPAPDTWLDRTGLAIALGKSTTVVDALLRRLPALRSSMILRAVPVPTDRLSRTFRTPPVMLWCKTDDGILPHYNPGVLSALRTELAKKSR